MVPVQRHRLGERQRFRHAGRFQRAANHGNKADVVGYCIRLDLRRLPLSAVARHVPHAASVDGKVERRHDRTVVRCRRVGGAKEEGAVWLMFEL
jgi:hypothetical protein